MVPPTPAPTTRLLKAAQAEREQLARHRRELLQARESLRNELERIEGSLEEVAERESLLDRLAAPPSARTGAGASREVESAHLVAPRGEAGRGVGADARWAGDGAGDGSIVGAEGRDGVNVHAGAINQREGEGPRTTTTQDRDPGDVGDLSDAALVTLRGPEIRREAVRVLLAHPDRPEALHYREWFALLQDAGFTAGGKDPLATFLTQLSRSPAVRKGTQSGIYELDRGAGSRLRRRLDALHDELRALTATPAHGADSSAARTRRGELNAELSRVEKALDEIELVFAAAHAEPALVE
jgi:hypothetical protein